MAGLIPDQAQQIIGDANGIGGDRMQGPGGITEQPWRGMLDQKPSATIIKINGDKITIIDGARPAEKRKAESFDDNLAEDLDSGALSQIAADLIEGIDADIRARQAFVENYEKGLDYLGTKMVNQSVARGRRSTAKVFHPALQWACVKFQSGCRGEMLPAAGPAKVQVAGMDTFNEEKIARDFEQDFNYYLTVAAPEYYPDTDRGNYYLAYGGSVWKKIYRDPIRQRPVVDNLYIPDLIVSPESSDPLTAQRITHDIPMMDRDVRMLMDLGIYRDIALSVPTAPENRLRKKEKEIAGKRSSPDRPQDTPHTIYETYCFLDLARFGLKEKDQPKSIRPGGYTAANDDDQAVPIPYRVTIDKDSRAILEIRRNWKQGDRTFRRRQTFVKYSMIPGMGGQDYGYLHLIGNVVQALTALLRLTIDAGMFSIFPGGIRLKGARTDTNEINPAPGEWAELDVVVDDIKKALMPMPYKEPSLVVFQLMQYLEGQIKTIAGAVEFEVGEGKTNIPVGTMMAMIEQQTQVMASIHKRLHTAQKEELLALHQLFVEYPEDLDRFAGVSGRNWASTGELADMKIVPRSDPNIPAQTHRLMQSTALSMLAGQPNFAPLMEQGEVLNRLLMNIGIGDPQSLIKQQPPQPQAPPPDPKILLHQQDATIKQAEMQADAQKDQMDGELRLKELGIESQDRAADRASREKIAEMKLHGESIKMASAQANKGLVGGGAPPQ